MSDKKNPPEPRNPPELPKEESRIIIRPNGEVVIENLSELLAEVAAELDPDDLELVCLLEEPDEGSEGDSDKE